MIETLKILHLFSVFAWMAGLFYLPRLFVYHAEIAQNGKITQPNMDEKFKIMERRLLRAIMNPAMLASFVFGLWLMVEGGFMREIWLHIKLSFAILLAIFHMFLAYYRKCFERGKNRHSARFFRIINEIPTILLLLILILVVVKP